MKHFRLIPVCLAVVALAACSRENSALVQGESETPIRLASSIAQTRSTNVNLQRTQVAQGVKVGVFAKTESVYVSDGDNAVLTADGAGNFTGTTLYFPKDGSAVSVYAYAPYSAAFDGNLSQAVDFTVAADQSSDAGYLASDLLWGVPAGTNAFTQASPLVTVNFAHKLAKLTVKFTIDEDVEINLGGASVKIVGTLPSTTLTVADGTLGAASGTAADIKAATFAADATEFLASAILVPQTVEAGNFLEITLSDKVLYAELGTEATFVSGKSYTYNVNIGPEKTTIGTGSTVTDWDEDENELTGDVTEGELPEPEPITLTATFQTPGSNASYDAPTYTWSGSTSNLMTVFEFANGELANYHTLKFTFSNLVDGPVRMGYYVGSTFTEIGNGYYSAGEKTVDLTALGIDLATVTKIAFGGRSNAGSCDILASDVILIGNAEGTDSGDEQGNDEPAADGKLHATFGTPGGNASYEAPTYTWNATNNNLMTCFEFAGGELADYTTLTFTISNLTGGTMVRMGYYVGSTFTEFGSGYGSNGTKTGDLTALGIDLSTVTKIAFGGRTGTGSVDILASDVILSK